MLSTKIFFRVCTKHVWFRQVSLCLYVICDSLEPENNCDSWKPGNQATFAKIVF